MTDSKYFTTTKKGEIFELKSELNSDKKEKKKEAVKKVSGKVERGEKKSIDRVMLFIDMLCSSSSRFFFVYVLWATETSGDCEHDSRQGCVGSVSRCRQLYANG